MERSALIELIGEHPLAKNSQGELVSRVGTVFPYADAVVTIPGIHATQRVAFVEILNRKREASGQPPLSEYEQNLHWENSVDLVIDDDVVLIRPDPNKMELAFDADELLQEIVPKHKIKFLHVMNEKVRHAIKARGECWRIAPLPRSVEEIKRLIMASRIGIGGENIYYYNRGTGTRILTCGQFGSMAEFDEAQLRVHLSEIQDFTGRKNRHGHPEITLFKAGPGFTPTDFEGLDFYSLCSDALQEAFCKLYAKFRAAVPPEFRNDDQDDVDWRREIVSALVGQDEQAVPEEVLLGMSAEFYMQIEWVPGGRIEDGELIFDTVFEEAAKPGADPALVRLCDEKAKGFIFNFIREYGDLEFVNIGRVTRSLSRRPAATGRRDVYIAEVKLRDADHEVVRIIRMIKWGIREHLEEGKSLLDSIMQAEEYAEYILDRRLGCRQLGMHLPARIVARKIAEPYLGNRNDVQCYSIWATYIERDYVHGIATDKTTPGRFASPEFAERFSRLLGEAAAVNLVVGRTDLAGHVVFDDGDEVILYNPDGLPRELVISDPTGTFNDYTTPLATLVAEYGRAINARMRHVPDPVAFSSAYINAFGLELRRIQQEYRKRKRGFDNLFKHRRRDERGSFAYRWEQVLLRLNACDVQDVVYALSSQIRVTEAVASAVG